MGGRDDTVRALDQQLQLERFVSLIGLGGVGKRTVAVAVAHAFVRDLKTPLLSLHLR